MHVFILVLVMVVVCVHIYTCLCICHKAPTSISIAQSIRLLGERERELQTLPYMILGM